jgi:broad specificity phosphatase PhoE
LRLILIRHAETQWNKERRIQGGSSDTGLSEVGLSQARQLASFFEKDDINVIASSPLQRALDTANFIAQPHKIQVKVDERLREIEVGDLEGLSWANLDTSFTQFLLQKWQGGGTKNLPGGESFVQLQQRVWDSVEQLQNECNSDNVIIVSHYFATLAIIFRALDISPEHLPKFRIGNGGISILEYASYGPRLVTFNNTSFLNREKA